MDPWAPMGPHGPPWALCAYPMGLSMDPWNVPWSPVIHKSNSGYKIDIAIWDTYASNRGIHLCFHNS